MAQKIFSKKVSAPRMLLLLMVALGLMLADRYTTWLEPVRAWVESGANSLSRAGDLLGRAADWSSTHLTTPGELTQENQQLRAENLVLKGQLQQLAELTAENAQLRSLLNAAPRAKLRLLMTELIGVSPDPMRHQIRIDRGSRDAVFVGQPVIDARGLMGQVVEVREDSAEVLLISDERHAVPVTVLGTEVRAIAEGTGDYHRLRLRHVQPTLDVTMNDLLVTSGLGGRFPPGYAVGRVTGIAHERGQAFMEVSVEPIARLDRSRHLLLVFAESETEAGDAASRLPAEPD
ncbi:MAG: rod shape-determining protein MreC [Porticoccaceae bacterium]|jgi:rod shape-determining protein MreC|nr:rod shape-determining protein MreC [Porticoccaceae bacterium]